VHQRSISTARAVGRFCDMPWCSTSVSAICRPMVSTGLSEVIGSWKIIEISLPRIAHLAARRAQQVAAVERMRPGDAPGGIGIRRRIDMAVTLLPQPDSPTMASVSPR
jgi:hypothetical protein